MDGFATFVINLDRATARMDDTDAQLENVDLPYTRVSAVAGATVEAPDDAMAYLERLVAG